MKKLFTLAAALLTSFSMYAGGPYVWNPSTAVSSGEISEKIEGEVVISAYNGAIIEEKEMASSTKAFGIKIGTSGNSSLDAGYIEISIVNDNNTISEVSLGASSNADAVKNYAAVYFSSKTCNKDNIISGETLVSVAKKVGNITDRQELNVPEGTKMIRIYRKINSSATGLDSDLGDGSTIYVYSFSVVTEGDVTEPVKTVTLAGETEAYIGVATTITATATPSATEYKWFVDGAEQAGETAKTFNFTPTEVKTYAITCQARNEYNNDVWVASAALNLTAQKLCGELIKVTQTGQKTANVEALIFDATADMNLSSGTTEYEGQVGRKIGSKNYYFGFTLKNGATFKRGDEVTIFLTPKEAGSDDPGCQLLQLFSDKGTTLIGEKTEGFTLGANVITLTTDAESIYLYRTETADSKMNPFVAYISVTRDCDESAKLSVSPTEVTLNATAAEPTVSATVTISGKNLTPNTYNFTMPQVAGLTINPASVTVGEDGFLSEIVTISYTSEANVATTSTTIELSIGSLTEHITVNYSADMVRNYATSLNIEQLVLDNGKGYDIAGAFAEHNLDAGFTFNSNNALDSLDNKDYRNYPYLGLKLKTSGATIGLWLKQGSTLNVRLGNMGADVKVSGTGEEETLTADKYANIDNDADNKVYTYTAADADAYVLFTTTGSGTTVFKQIMIDEDIKVVTLPGDGNTGSGLDNVNVELNLNAPMYNVLGVQVDSNYNGIVIQNGKKFMLK